MGRILGGFFFWEGWVLKISAMEMGVILKFWHLYKGGLLAVLVFAGKNVRKNSGKMK